MEIVFLGNGERGCVCLEAIASEHNVSLVVALPDSKQPDYSRNLANVANALGLRVEQPQEVNSPGFVELVRSVKPDVLVLAGYNRLIRQPLIQASALAINLHASPLPAYRGAAPLNWMLINGETRGALSIIAVDEGVDTGDILAQEWFDITPEDNYTSLYERTLKRYPPMLLDVLRQVSSSTLQRIRQHPQQGSFYTKRYPKDGEIDWKRMTDVEIHNLVRSQSWPMPGAFTYYQSGSIAVKVILEHTRIIEREYKGVSGRVAARWPSGVVVVCSNRGLLIETCRKEVSVPAREVLPNPGMDLGIF